MSERERGKPNRRDHASYLKHLSKQVEVGSGNLSQKPGTGTVMTPLGPQPIYVDDSSASADIEPSVQGAGTKLMEEAGPTNPIMLTEEQIAANLEEFQRQLEDTETVFDADPAYALKLEEETGFDYHQIKARMEEAERKLKLTNKIHRYTDKLQRLKRKYEAVSAKLEAYRPTMQKDELAERMPSQAEAAQLQPPPQTAAGQAAEAQRESMKEDLGRVVKITHAIATEVAQKTIENPVDRLALAAALAKELDDEADRELAFVDGKKNPPAKVSPTPGKSGSSEVYRVETGSSPIPAPALQERPSKVAMAHKPGDPHREGTVKCSVCGDLEKIAQPTTFKVQKSYSFTGVKIWKSADGIWYVAGIASDTFPDLEKDQMLPSALYQMADKINAVGVPMHDEHNHKWVIGEWTKAIVNNGQLHVQGVIETPNYEPKPKVFLSIGGDSTGFYENGLRKLSGVDLEEISLVGIPANPRSEGSAFKI